MIEYGVQWAFKSDPAAGHTSGGYTLVGAQSQVKNAGDPKKFHPYAARVVERDVSDWREAESPAVQGDSTPKSGTRSGRIGAELKTPRAGNPGLTPSDATGRSCQP